MVHRPSDSRLLSNLLQHEKEYVKSLNTQLEHSQVSIASFSAFAAASPPPTSHAINTVVGALVGADEALRRYTVAVEEWCEMLRALKEREEDVGSVMRDREILVDRLIKASKSTKANRRSFISSPNPSHFGSSTQLSLSSDQNHSPLANPKLALAQSELQACEAHLAERERELADVRTSAISKGLVGRCQALVDCGWTLGEMGKDGVKALQALQNNGVNGVPNGYGHYLHANDNSTGTASPHRPSSDMSSSISPSQSASQNGHIAFQNPGHSSSLSRSFVLESSTPTPSAQQTQSYRLSIPPAHSISDQLLPPSVAERRITEEPENDLGGSSAEEAEEERVLEVHENERFAASSKGKGNDGVTGRKKSQRRKKANTVIVSRSNEKATFADRSRPESVQFPTSSSAPPGFPLGVDLSSWPRPSGSVDNIHAHTTRERKKSGFLNSIASLFKPSTSLQSYHPPAAVESESPSRWKSTSRWTTRTDKNLRHVKDDNSSEEGVHGTRIGTSDTAIDYEALRRKSMVEAKALPEPSGGKRLRKASRKGGPTGGRRGSTERRASESGGGVGSNEGNKLNERLNSRETPISILQTHTSVFNPSASINPESNVTVVRSSSRAASLDGARPVLKKHNDKRRSIDVVSDSGHSPSSTPPHLRTNGHTNGTGSGSLNRSIPPSASGTRFPALSNPAQPSLMSIIENVSAQNRANWGKSNPNSLLVAVKAPQPVAAGTSPYVGAQRDSGSPSNSAFASKGKASPVNGGAGSRIGRPPSPTMIASHVLDSNRLSTISASASAPSLPLRSGGSDVSSVYSQHSGTPPSRPLRSALRTRTPSPNPVHSPAGNAVTATSLNPNAQNQIYSPRIPGTTNADAVMLTGMRTTKAKASTGTFGQPVIIPSAPVDRSRECERDRMSDASSEVTVNQPISQPSQDVGGSNSFDRRSGSSSPIIDTVVSAPLIRHGHADDPEKRWSVTSFASGDEDFQDALESMPPTPPPHDEDESIKGAFSQRQTREQSLGQSQSNQLGGESPVKSISPSEQSQSTERGRAHIQHGVMSDETINANGIAEPPVRRKSVRMSLQPTFSTTPPAMEDYEDEDDEGETNRASSSAAKGKRDYWSSGTPQANSSNPQANGNSNGWTSRINEANPGQVWEDSSEEEEEYSLAKQLLLRQILGEKSGKGKR